MTGMTRPSEPLAALEGLTTWLEFNLINFDWYAWHDCEHDNWEKIDPFIQILKDAFNYEAVWADNTTHYVGRTYFDDDLGTLWLCTETHLSSTGVDFATDRAGAHSDKWIAAFTGMLGDNRQRQIDVTSGTASYGTLAGAVDGANPIYTTSKPYIAGTLVAVYNGQPQNDITETDPANGIFTMSRNPVTGTWVMAMYDTPYITPA